MALPDVRKSAVQLFQQVLDSHVLRELRTLGIVVLLHAKMRTEALKHLNDPCCSALGEKVHLQI